MRGLALQLKGAVAMLLAVAALSVSGAIDGAVRPVVTDVEFVLTPADDLPGWSRMSGSFYKARDNCRFAGLEATYNGIAIPVVLEEGAKVRDGGWHDFGPWRIQVTEDQIPGLEMIALHKCAFGLDLSVFGGFPRSIWPTTRTVFWPTVDVQ